MTTATNPYTAPQGELIGDGQQTYADVRFFSPACRIGRMRYLAHAFLLVIAFAALFGVIAAVGMGNVGDGGGVGAFAKIAIVLTYLAYMVCIWIVNIQRCHDLNKSGWFSLLLLVPAVNIFVALYMLFAPGTPGENSYGKRPPPNSKVLAALAFAVPVIFFIGGILAAIAVPAYQDYVERANQAVIQQQ